MSRQKALPLTADDVAHSAREKQRIAFRTYAGYARAWRTIATRDDTPHHEWAQSGALAFDPWRLSDELGGEIGPMGISPHDVRAARQAIWRTWSTEQLMYETFDRLAHGSSSGDLLRSAAPWIAVQAYYTCFSATQALESFERGNVLEKHRDVRRSFCELWSPDTCDVRPFSASASARPAQIADAVEFAGLPPGTSPDRTDPKSYWTRFDAWDVAGMSLQTTLRSLLDERYAEKRAQKTAVVKGRRPRLSPRERESIRAKSASVTLLDVLHRIRVVANYRDVDVFLIGPGAEGDDAVRFFIVNLMHTTSALLLATEMRMAFQMKKGLMAKVIEAWTVGATEGGRMAAPISDRVAILESMHGG